MGSVIHVDYDCSRIRGDTLEAQAETVLRNPSDSEAREYFLKAISEDLEYDIQLSSTASESKVREIQGEIRTTVDRLWEEKLTQISLADLAEEIIVLSNESGEFPYFLGGDVSRTILRDIWTSLGKQLRQKGPLSEVLP